VWEKGLDDLGIPNSGNLNMGNLDSISNNAGKIATKVAESKERWGVEKVTIVAHSKGGLDSRHYIENADDIQQLIQLGTPNGGSPLANVAQAGALLAFGATTTILVNALLTPAGYQLTTTYMSIYNANHGRNKDTQYTSVGGDYDPDCFLLNPFCRPLERMLLSISGSPGDTIVPLWSAHALPYSTPILFPSSGANKDATHSELHQSNDLFT